MSDNSEKDPHQMACSEAYDLAAYLFDYLGIFSTEFAEAWLDYFSDPERQPKPESCIPPEDALAAFGGERDRYMAALNDLQRWEKEYRQRWAFEEVLGYGAMDSRHALDQMRQAGDRARHELNGVRNG